MKNKEKKGVVTPFPLCDYLLRARQKKPLSTPLWRGVELRMAAPENLERKKSLQRREELL